MLKLLIAILCLFALACDAPAKANGLAASPRQEPVIAAAPKPTEAAPNKQQRRCYRFSASRSQLASAPMQEARKLVVEVILRGADAPIHFSMTGVHRDGQLFERVEIYFSDILQAALDRAGPALRTIIVK